MKITEIFGSPSLVVTKHQKQALNSVAYLGPRLKKLHVGAAKYGSFGVVLPHTTDVATVTKSSINAYKLKEDPYYLFATHVYKHNLAEDNLYLPRFYGVTQTIDTRGDVVYNVDMEELTTFYLINAKEIKAALLKMGVQSDWEGYSGLTTMQFLLDSISTYCRLKERYILTLGNRNTLVSVTDNKFYEALDVWRYIKKKNAKFEWDVHTNNIMWRQTSTGKQLVLTDLLANFSLKDI